MYEREQGTSTIVMKLASPSCVQGLVLCKGYGTQEGDEGGHEKGDQEAFRQPSSPQQG